MLDGAKRQESEAEARLVDLIYQTAFDDRAWSVLVDELSRFLPEGKAVLFYHDTLSASGALTRTSGIDATSEQSYNSHYNTTNPWMRFAPFTPVGTAHRAEQMVARGDLVRTEFYADFLRPMGVETGVGLNIMREAGRAFLVSILCAPTSDAHLDEAAALLTRLSPHLRRMLDLHRATDRGPSSPETAAHLLGVMDAALICVGTDRKVKWANDRGRAALARGDIAREDAHGAVTLEPPEAHDLMEATLTPPATGRAGPRTGTFHLPAGDDTRVRLTVVGAKRSSMDYFFGGPAAYVILQTTHAPLRARLDDCRRLYGLTARETQIVEHLAQGRRPAEIADVYGLSRETIRGHMKSIFAKMGVHRQAEIVAKVLRSMA